MSIFEIRRVIGKNGDSWLESRYCVPLANASGAVCCFSDWSDWEAIPVVHESDIEAAPAAGQEEKLCEE